MHRNRTLYAGLILLVTVIGGSSRLPIARHFPAFFAEYAGDTFWALLVYVCLGFLFPTWRIRTIALSSLAIAYGVEVFQLYQAPWINAVRETFLGAVLLGSGFLWSDFLCYTAGVAMGVAGETFSDPTKEREV